MNPLFLESTATIAVMVLTVGTSLVSFTLPELWRMLALEPYKMAVEHQYHPIITAGFIHSGGTHLFVNMLTLYFFGPWLELQVGGMMFLLIYVVSLVVGNVYPFIKYRDQPDYVAIGASGAISGILFSFCLFNPMAKLYVFFAIPMPAIVFAVLYTAYSIYAMKRQQDNIGHEAHLAGALGGVIITLIAYPEIIGQFF